VQDPEQPTVRPDAAPALDGGRYRLLEELGEGGAARVYKAVDTRTGEDCAVKVLRQDVPGDDGPARFAREAQVLAQLDHPHLVRVHAVGQDGDRHYLVMELLEGGSLQDRLEAEGPLESPQVQRILVDVLAALAEVHRHHVIHRDVKPGNLLVDHDGRIKLADFGIARIEGSLTRTGTTVGTYAFMAPEQLEDPRAVGPAADLYGAAATAMALALGQPPFGLQDPGRRSELLSQLAPGLAAVLERALLRDPASRWPSADAMGRALAGEVPDRALRRVEWALGIGLTAAIAVFAFGLWGVSGEPPRQSRPLTTIPVLPPATTQRPAPEPVEVVAPEPEPPAAPAVVRPAQATPDPTPAPPSDPPATEPEPPPAPSPVEVFIHSRPWSELYVDGRPLGHTPWTGELLPGPHQVRLVRTNGTEYALSLAVPAEGGTRFCWDFDEEAACPGR